MTREEKKAIAERMFFASPLQKRAKAKFINALKNNPLIDPHSLTSAEIAKLTRSTKIKQWLADPQFKDWFLDKDEVDDKLEYLSNLALDRIETALLDDNTAPKDIIGLSKIIMEATGKARQHQQRQAFLDKQIQSMTEEELEKFIKAQNSVKEVVDVEQIEAPKGDSNDVP